MAPQETKKERKSQDRKKIDRFIRRKAPSSASVKSYSRFVRSMRLLLPLIAVALTGILFSWPRVEETISIVQEESFAPYAVVHNELLKPHFESKDEKGQPFKITAAKALQSTKNQDLVTLESPVADITLQSGSWLSVLAEEGFYRQEAENLSLSGKVTLFHDKGYELKTEKMVVNLKTRHVSSDTPIYAQGPAGTLEATGLRGDMEKEKLIFTGPVHLVLNRSIKGL